MRDKVIDDFLAPSRALIAAVDRLLDYADTATSRSLPGALRYVLFQRGNTELADKADELFHNLRQPRHDLAGVVQQYDIALLVDQGVRDQRVERSKTQMTLKKMCDALGAMPAGRVLPYRLTGPHVYCSYPEDLAFGYSKNQATVTVGELYTCCLESIDTCFAFEGSERMMDADTPIWIASYREEGVRLLGITADGSLII